MRKQFKLAKIFIAVLLCMAMVFSGVLTFAVNVGEFVDVRLVDTELGMPAYTTKLSTYKAGVDTDEWKENDLSINIGADLYTNYFYSANKVVDSELGDVAVMKKGVTDTVANKNLGVVLSGVKNVVTVNTDTGYDYTYDFCFKTPVSEDVITYLMCSSNSPWSGKDQNSWSSFYTNFLTKHRGMKVTNGYIYLKQNDDNFETAVNTTPLNGDTWYRVLYRLKGPKGTSTPPQEQILVLSESGEVVVKTNWSATEHSVGSSQMFAAVGFMTEYSETYEGTEAAVSNLKIYGQTSYFGSASLVNSNRILQYDASTSEGTWAPIAERITGRATTYKRENVYVTLRLSDVNGTMKLFKWNDSNSKFAGFKFSEFIDVFAVTIRDGKIYANVYDSRSTLNDASRLLDSNKKGSLTNLVALPTGEYYTEIDTGISLDANKWYTIELERPDMTDATAQNVVKVYEGRVARDPSTQTIVGNLLDSWGDSEGESFVLPYIDPTVDILGTDKNERPSNQPTITFFSGYGFASDKPVYIDAMDLMGWAFKETANLNGGSSIDISQAEENADTANILASYGSKDNWVTGYESEGSYAGTDKHLTNEIFVGDDYFNFRYKNHGALQTTGQTGNCIGDIEMSLGKTKIVYDSDFLLTGELNNTELPTVKFQLPVPISFDENMVSLTYAGEPINFRAEYNENDYSISVTAEEILNYDKTYTLTFEDMQTELFGFQVKGASYTFTVKDLFTATDLTILGATPGEYLAVGDSITATVTLHNSSLEDRPYLLMLAIYKDGQMIALESVSNTINSSTVGVSVETEPYIVMEQGCTTKAMLWESWSNIAPKIAAEPN